MIIVGKKSPHFLFMNKSIETITHLRKINTNLKITYTLEVSGKKLSFLELNPYLYHRTKYLHTLIS